MPEQVSADKGSVRLSSSGQVNTCKLTVYDEVKAWNIYLCKVHVRRSGAVGTGNNHVAFGNRQPQFDG